MAIVRTGAIRRRSPCGPQRQRRTARPVFSCSARNGGPDTFRGRQGKKVRTGRCGQGGRGVSRSWSDQPLRGPQGTRGASHGRGNDRLPLDRARSRQHASCKDRLWRAGGNGACPGRASVLRDCPLSPRLCLSAVMFGLPTTQVDARPGPCATTWVSVIWLCSAGPAQPQRGGDGEDRDLLPQSVAVHADDVGDGMLLRKLHRAFSVRRKTCADVGRTWR